MTFHWTDENIATLKTLVATGISASQIAAKMGVTRNSAMGKCARLGLTLGMPSGGIRKYEWTDDVSAQALKMWNAGSGAMDIKRAFGMPLDHKAISEKMRSLGGRKGHLKGKSSLSRFNSAMETRVRLARAAAAVAPEERRVGIIPEPIDEVAIPPSERVTIMDLCEHHCRWPMSDPRDPAFRFCGERKAYRSYCADHAMLAYTPRAA